MPSIIGSVLRLVGLVSVHCDWVRLKVWSATFLSKWHHVNLSEQIHPRDKLACCRDIKQTSNQPTNHHHNHHHQHWHHNHHTTKPYLSACRRRACGGRPPPSCEEGWALPQHWEPSQHSTAPSGTIAALCWSSRHSNTWNREKLFVGCLTSQQQASVSQGQICSDKFTCCHIEIEVADPTFYLTQSQYTDIGPTSPSADPITPGAWQGSHWSANFWVTGTTRPRKNPITDRIRTWDLPLSRRTPYH